MWYADNPLVGDSVKFSRPWQGPNIVHRILNQATVKIKALESGESSPLSDFETLEIETPLPVEQGIEV